MLLAILIVCLPISVDLTIDHSGHVGGAAGIMISAFDMVLLLLYLLWFAELSSKNKRNVRFFPEISIPTILLILVACLSMLRAEHPLLSLYELIEIIKMYLAFFYLANNIRTKKEVEFIAVILIACLLFEGFLGWAQHRTDTPLFPTALGGPKFVDSRVKGTWVSYNDFAWCLTFFIPLSFSLIGSQIKLTSKIICFCALVLGTGSLLWTNSRAGWISLGIAWFFVGVLVFSKIKVKKVIVNTAIVLILAIILAIPLYPRLYGKIYGRFAGQDGGSAISRFPQFEVAYNIIKDNPILGIGLNNYSKVMWGYDTTEEGLGEFTIYPVHNIFMHLAAEIGIFGAAMFFVLILVIFYTGLNYIIIGEGFTVYMIIGLLAGILAFLSHGLYDTASIGSKMFMFFWCFAGIIFGIKEMQQKKQHAIS